MMFSWQEVQNATNGVWLAKPQTDSCTAVIDDSRKIVAGCIFVAVVGELSDGHAYIRQAVAGGAAAICVQHISDEELAEFSGIGVLQVSDTLLAFQQLAAANRRRFSIPVLAVTGSCGKTSSKEMCAAVFNELYPEHVIKTQGNTNNHFGVPRNLLRIDDSVKAAVIEAGSNHPGEIKHLASLIQPTCALITCIGAAHLEFFKSLEGVAEEKGDVFQAVAKGGWAVMPYECAGKDILLRHAEGLNVMTFGTQKGADVQAIYGGAVEGGYLLTLLRRDTGEHQHFVWGIGGEAQAGNAAGAAAVGIIHGLSLARIAAGLQKCTLPGNRMKIAEIAGIRLINDAYNANPDSMAASLKWFAEISKNASSVKVVLGDMRELGENALAAHEKTKALAISLFGKENVILVGELFAAIAGDVEHYMDVNAFASAVHFQKDDWVFLKASQGTGLFKFEGMIGG